METTCIQTKNKNNLITIRHMINDVSILYDFIPLEFSLFIDNEPNVIVFYTSIAGKGLIELFRFEKKGAWFDFDNWKIFASDQEKTFIGQIYSMQIPFRGDCFKMESSVWREWSQLKFNSNTFAKHYLFDWESHKTDSSRYRIHLSNEMEGMVTWFQLCLIYFIEMADIF
jgi:hypothetical protein